MLVKLKMKTIYKSFLSLVGLSLLIILSLLLVYMIFYNKMHKESDIDVNGYLSINYDDGKEFEIDERKAMNFTVINSNEEIMYYNINLNNIKNLSSYKLYDNKNKIIKSGKLRLGNNKILNNILIKGKSSSIYKMLIVNENDKKPLKGKIEVTPVETVVVSFAKAVLRNNKPVDNPITKPGIELSETNEGLIKNQDDYGTTYYFRGICDNNYVSIGSTMWRIVRINGDNSVRLVLDGLSDNVSSMYSHGSYTFSYEKSKIKEYLKIWLEDNLRGYESYLANNKFCNDINHDENYLFQAYTRLSVNKIPTFTCLGDIINSNIGLLSADEVVMAGAGVGLSNTNFYLYNSNITSDYFTLTAAKGDTSSLNMYMLDNTGKLNDDIVGSLYRGVRPVINIIKNVEVSGLGTKLDSYKIITK